jgi:hypothetical protein
MPFVQLKPAFASTLTLEIALGWLLTVSLPPLLVGPVVELVELVELVMVLVLSLLVATEPPLGPQ